MLLYPLFSSVMKKIFFPTIELRDKRIKHLSQTLTIQLGIPERPCLAPLIFNLKNLTLPITIECGGVNHLYFKSDQKTYINDNIWGKQQVALSLSLSLHS